eukprot:COSAG02_NODE_437_length_22340_cov_46.269952_15_plen_94_part_00
MEASPSPTSICSLVSIAPGIVHLVGPCDTGAGITDGGSRVDEPSAIIATCSPSNGDGEKGEVPSTSSPGCGTATISCDQTVAANKQQSYPKNK